MLPENQCVFVSGPVLPPCTSVTVSCRACCSEMWFVSPDKWHSVRGGQMILVMKAVSVGLDLSGAAAPAGGGGGGCRPTPGPLQYAGYLLHPGTTVFGPWIALDDYLTSMERRPLEVSQTSADTGVTAVNCHSTYILDIVVLEIFPGRSTPFAMESSRPWL